MPSASSPVKEAIESYVAGRERAERLVIAIAVAYYSRDGGRGTGDGLRPLIEVIDRASPGIVELGTAQGGPGFAIRLAERTFPKHLEADLRRAAEMYLEARPGRGKGEEGRVEPGFVSRIVAAVRRLFTPSA